MDEILRQLVPLLLGSVPTIVIFVGLVIAYQLLVRGPLERTLAERRKRTLGAVERAHAAIEAADVKAREYESKLRAARNEIFKAREARMQVWNAERESALASARQAAHEQVGTARAVLELQIQASRQEIERSTDSLAEEILKAVLPKGIASSGLALGEVPR